MKIYLCGIRAEKEACRIKRLFIKERENGINLSFRFAVGFSVGAVFDGKQHMEFGARRPAAFFLEMGAAVMDGKGDAGESLLHVFGRDPIFRGFRMVIIAVNGQTVRTDEIIVVAVVTLVCGAYIVMADGGFQFVCIIYGVLIGVQAVVRHADNLGGINGKHQFLTSLQSSVK